MDIVRIILFVRDLDGMVTFYDEVLGLIEVAGGDAVWREFDAGGCRIALHGGGRGERSPRTPKVVFYCDDVGAERDRLNARGAGFGKVKVAGDLHLCDGEDPEGNALQLSNRR